MMDEMESELDIPKYIGSFYIGKFRAVIGNSQHPLPSLLIANLRPSNVLPKAQHGLYPFKNHKKCHK
ncbi:hypothetical protein XELAEV_18024129mg [Xenopus laevis]|uniref:Uncharacterized protein n=1 Tax=Xenopus laevis TaxID=8355 RepID=A0A974D5E2_XENLA|nr:hypothetical protein XELAEV_18024129mg [Xenopus laevis]